MLEQSLDLCIYQGIKKWGAAVGVLKVGGIFVHTSEIRDR
jgi:hypothetical protein